nr:MAG TPA: hypothetical protein [Caudoviricetes sp.]
MPDRLYINRRLGTNRLPSSNAACYLRSIPLFVTL